MPKTKLTVKTDIGTFTRTTARTYTHILVAKDVRHEVLEAQRLDGIRAYRRNAAEYRETVANGGEKGDRSAWSREHTRAAIADGSYARYIAEADATAAELDANGPVTTDRETDWTVLGWAGRLDLARKLLARQSTDYGDSPARYRHVRLYDVTTGQQVRW